MRIAGPNVGIGTTAPTEALQVTGNISASGFISASGELHVGSIATLGTRINANLIGANGNVGNTEYGYLNGLTGNIQDQIGTLQPKPSEGAFEDGDKTKLNTIATNADVTPTGNSGNAAIFDNSGTPTLKTGITQGEMATALGYEAGADVTDATNVAAAGALMDTEVTSLALIKSITAATISGSISAASVTAAGALMDSEVSVVNIKNIDQALASGDAPNFATDNMTDASNKRFMTDAQETKLDGLTAAAISGSLNAATVAAAGALMDSEIADLTHVKNIDQALESGASPTFTDVIISDDVRLANNSKIISENTSTTNILLNNDDGFVITTNNVEAARMFSSGFIINENGAASMDFRVESDSNQYALFVDSGNNQVVVGGTAGFGGALFSVNGAISSSSTITGTTGSFDVITGNNEVGTSLEVAGPITGSSFQGTKHILVNNGFYVNANPFTQNSLYFGGTLQHNPFNWNDPQAIGGDPMTVANFDISDDDQNWGRILPFDVSKIEILCGLRPGAGAGDQFSLVLYTASRITGAVTAITLTRVAQNGVTFDGSGKYTNNDLTYTGDLTAGTMIYVGVGTNTSSPSAKNARGYMSVTITAK